MAELTIELRVDPESGKKDVLVHYRGGEDALPLEHEDAHRALVERLVEGGVLEAGELGRIVLERAGGEQEERRTAQAEEVIERRAEELGE